MDFDQILEEEIGEFGRFQQTNYLLICLPVLFAAANSLSYVFTAGAPAYRCRIAECDDKDPTILYPNWLANAIPSITNKLDIYTPHSCYRYPLKESINPGNESSQLCNSKDNFDADQQHRCYEWIFDKNDRTIVQEWNLTCQENSWKLAFVGTIHFAGLVVGTGCSGYLADRFGRKIIFIICIIFMAVTGIGQGLSWDYNSFIVFAFLNAVGTSGVYPLAFILGVEMVGPKKREMSSILLNYFYAVGESLVGLSAWLFGDWQLVQYALSIPPIFFIGYYWLLPESVRWLIARNELEKAKVIIMKAAEINGRQISKTLLQQFEMTSTSDKGKQIENTGKLLNNNNNNFAKLDETIKRQIYFTVKAVFRSRILIFRYTLLLFIWAINAIVYYGLSLNSTNLSGNKYLNFSLVCLVEIPGYSIAWIALNKFGRRLSLTGSLFLCSLTCAVGAYITKVSNWAIIGLFLLGKLGITSSFAVIYAYTTEMMPTIIRSGGVGVMSTFARFGAMLAPFVPLLNQYYEALPLLVFALASMTAGLLALLLPETFRKRLPDTVLEAEQLDKL